MRFIVFAVIADLLLTATTLLYYKYVFKGFRGVFCTSLYLFLSVNIIISYLLSDAYPSDFLRMDAYLSGLWLGVLFYSLIIMVLHLLIAMLAGSMGVNIRHKVVALGMMVIFGAAYIYGCYNAFRPVVRHESISTNKLAAGAHLRIAMVSDIHLGKVLGRNFAKDVVELINRQNPDVVVIAGDLADGKISYILKENSLEPFRWIDAPYGVYMALGNHDYFDNVVRWQRILKFHKIRVLQGKSIFLLNGAVKLSGLVDFSKDKGTEDIKRLAGGNEQVYSILVDHQPRRISAAREGKYDLYLSGHTHTGQIFPNRLFTYFLYDIDYGRKQFGDMTAIVSSGIGFWGPPVRSFVSPEIVVIDIEGTGSRS